MSIRTQRVASAIQRAVQKAIAKGLSDPRVRGLITITSVEVDEDLRHANLRVSVMPAEHAELTMHGLKAAAKHIRHLIADDLVLKQTPHLRFKLDTGASKQAGVFIALAQVRQELDALDPPSDESVPSAESDAADGSGSASGESP